MKLSEAFERYALNVQIRRGRDTNCRHILYASDVLCAYLGDREVASLTTADVEAFAAERSRKVSRNTVNATLRQLKACLRRGVRSGWLPALELPVIELLTVHLSEPRIVSESEFAELIACSESPLREALCVAYEAGLRIGEIAHLAPADIDFERRLVHVRAKPGWQPKAGYDRASWLSKPLAQELKGPVESCGSGLFASPRKKNAPRTDLQVLAKGAFEKAGLVGLGFHALRRSWATRAAARGVPMSILQKAGGWRSLSVVQRYVTASLDDVAIWCN